MEKKYKTIPFDVNRINEKGVEVITRSGRSVRVICTNKKLDTEFSKNPIVALLSYTGKYGTYEIIMCYTQKGKIDNREDNNDDLFLKIPIKTRRMTNQELSWWLRECPEEHREWKRSDCSTITSTYTYFDYEANDECYFESVIRSNGGEWKEPLIEIND